MNRTEKNNLKIVHELFHKNTTSYINLIDERNFTYRNIIRVLNKYRGKKKTILDIGCGSGTISLYLANQGHTVDGIDISERAIDVCKESAKNLGLNKYTNFRVMQFPEEYPRKKYDLILLIEVIEHLENDQLSLKRVYDMLNESGIAIISTPSIRAPLHKIGYSKGFDKRVGHVRRYSLNELKNKSQKEGFKVIEAYGEEGVVRNFLFLSPVAGKSVKFIKFFLSDLVTFVDNVSLKLFGESDLFIILKK